VSLDHFGGGDRSLPTVEVTGDAIEGLLAWPPGHRIAEHVNDALDVLVVVLGGHGCALVDGEARDMVPGSAVLLPRGARREIDAGDEGLRYLTVHRRRGPLQIDPTPRG
jgi:quercetin dioxygenase-like cupin family protein